MRIGIVGGEGFIGRRTAELLLGRGDEVVSLDDLSVRPATPPLEVMERLHGCATNRKWIREFLGHKLDAILYLAAHQGYGPEWSEFGRVCVAGAYALFEELLADRADRYLGGIVLSSSQSVYAPKRRAKEIDPFAPQSVYGLAKLQQEQAFLALGKQLDVPIVALRYSIVLGAGQSDEGGADNGILRNSWRRVSEGGVPAIHGSGRQIRDWVHVSDVARANVMALDAAGEHGGKIFNVPGFERSVHEVMKIFREETGCGPPEIVANARPGGDFTLTSNGRRILDTFGWRPTVSVEDQVKEYVAWRRERAKEADAAPQEPADVVV